MPGASINCGAAAYEADTQQFERAVDCLVNKIGEIAWAVQLVCLKPGFRSLEPEIHVNFSGLTYEPRHEKTNILHMRKQRRRSVSW